MGENDEKYEFTIYDENEDLSSDIQETKSPAVQNYAEVDFKGSLNEEQLAIINAIAGPMLVIAGAGSGKTRTITYAVAKLLHSGVQPGQIMLVTFTNKAANEMIKRVEVLLGKRPSGLWAGTFHAIANRYLRKYSQSLGLNSNFTILDETDAHDLMRIAIQEANVKKTDQRFPTANVASNILSYSINCNKSIREVILWKYNHFDRPPILEKLDEVYQIYKAKKLQHNLVDFDDLLVYWNRLLDEKYIADFTARIIKYILVDEYQDTNYIQDSIIHKIAMNNPEHNIMVVGDDAQSIYAFRGANFKNILEFPKRYPTCKTYKITYNYRSVPEILEFANASISRNTFQHHKEMRSTRKSGGNKPFQVDIGDDEQQARFIANRVLQLRSEGIELRDIAVLYRAGHHSMKIELELQAKNIPYVVRSGISFFERAHIKDLLAHLRIISNPFDELAWYRVFASVPGLGKSSAKKIFSKIAETPSPLQTLLCEDFFSVGLAGERVPNAGKANLIAHVSHFTHCSQQDNPADIIDIVRQQLTEHIKAMYTDWSERLEDMEQLSVYAQNYTSIQRFLETLSLNVTNIESKTILGGNKQKDEQPMVLSSIHRAKGLEWQVVFIPMLSEEQFPSFRVIDDPDDLEEERRVFYVACTRAKDQLYLISPALVQSYGRHYTSRKSRFITELPPTTYKKASVKFVAK